MRSLLLLALLSPALACSRVTMATPNATVAVAGRTMDWPVDTTPDIVAAPVGQARDGGVGPGSLTWTANHGSVCTSFQGLGCVDGLNTAGLSCAINYLAEADIADLKAARAAAAASTSAGSPAPPPLLSITQWCQQALDLYATVDEVVSALGASPPPYTLTTLTLSTGDKAVGHLMLSDSTGASVIVEPVAPAGTLALHRTSNVTADAQADAVSVMTNGPLWPAMAALDQYQAIEGVTGGVPAGDASPDRFVRAAFWRRRTPVPSSPDAATRAVRSIMRTVASPIGVAATPGAPESCETQWMSVTDSTRLVYWLEPAGTLAVTVVPLAPLNLTSPASPVRLLETGTRQAELGGEPGLEAWKVVPAGGLPGMAGYAGPVPGGEA